MSYKVTGEATYPPTKYSIRRLGANLAILRNDEVISPAEVVDLLNNAQQIRAQMQEEIDCLRLFAQRTHGVHYATALACGLLDMSGEPTKILKGDG